MCFVWISEQTAIISLYNINWLVFITETECVYCAVRTGSLCVIQIIFFNDIFTKTAEFDGFWVIFRRRLIECVMRNSGEIHVQFWHDSLLEIDNWKAERRGQSDLAMTLKADSHTACRAHAVPLPCRAVNSHMPCRAPALLRQCRVLRESPRVSRKYPNC